MQNKEKDRSHEKMKIAGYLLSSKFSHCVEPVPHCVEPAIQVLAFLVFVSVFPNYRRLLKYVIGNEIKKQYV